MSVINSGLFPKALTEGLNMWFGQKYKEIEPICTKIYDSFTSNKQWEEDVGISGFGLAQAVAEGSPVPYDTAQMGFVTRYTHISYKLGFILTREMRDDNRYTEIGLKNAGAMARSFRQTKEVVAHSLLNLGFAGGSNPTYGDGKTMLASDHPNVAGGTWSNILSVASDLSEAALEQAHTDIRLLTDDKGLRANIMARTLIIPSQLKWEADRLLKSEYRVGTSNNDVNVMANGYLPGGIIESPYLTDPDAWFIKTDCPEGLKYFSKVAVEFKDDGDFDTDNAKFKGYERYSFGITDPRAIFGSPGA